MAAPFQEIAVKLKSFLILNWPTILQIQQLTPYLHFSSLPKCYYFFWNLYLSIIFWLVPIFLFFKFNKLLL